MVSLQHYSPCRSQIVRQDCWVTNTFIFTAVSSLSALVVHMGELVSCGAKKVASNFCLSVIISLLLRVHYWVREFQKYLGRCKCSIVFHMKTQFLFSCLFKTVLVKITQSSWEASGRVQASGQISQSLWGFPGGSDSKESICNAQDLGSIPGLGRSPGEGNGNPLQNSSLENSMLAFTDGGSD